MSPIRTWEPSHNSYNDKVAYDLINARKIYVKMAEHLRYAYRLCSFWGDSVQRRMTTLVL